MVTRRVLVQGLSLSLLGLASRHSNAASETPFLRVSGEIGAGEGPGERVFDAVSFAALPQTHIRTATPWHQDAVDFSGVSAKNLFTAVERRGANAQLIALNDYMVEASIDEVVAADGLFATHQNGVAMPISDKGPIFLLFPFDDRPELRHQAYYSRAVWQLSEVVVTT
ncbi:oxidoreductase [Aureimonas sp. SK2]|uniref:oxidoreductase n=1 Tax=Aureimonas sp. SK2 TaxID=3015992 RepID=UPI0024441F0C|nr:oxidoreductase [Aureimonas sp. SK2]